MKLRAQLFVALLSTSAATLLAAAAVLLPALRERLETQSASALHRSVALSEPEIARVIRRERNDTREGFVGIETSDALAALAHRTGARVALTDGTGQHRLYDSQTTPDDITDVLKALATGEPVSDKADGLLRIAIPLDQSSPRDPGAYFVLAVRKRTTDIAGAVRTVRDRLLLAGVIALSICVILAVGLSSAMVRRLKRLRESALRLVEQGPDADAVVDSSADEVGDLSRSFAVMQEALRKQENARRQFTATASHELRTPLTSLAGMLELLEEDFEHGLVDSREAGDQIAAARRQVERLQHLAAELLDLSRLDAGIELRSELVELGELARAVVAEFDARASRLDVAIRLDPGYGGCWVRADPDAVARILRILLDNALRYSPPGSAVCVDVRWANRMATVGVADEGRGVSDADRSRIFERFSRGVNAGGDGGFGLGLAIGRELARRSGGDLALDEHAEAGARFVLSLPTGVPSLESSEAAAS